MISVAYDLHTHSCLSPCGDMMMTPATIAGIGAVSGLKVMALTDHNTARNCPAFLKACEAYGITGIPGMELTTSEEVHVVCLFDTQDKALDFDGYVYKKLVKVKNNPDIFGEQHILNEDDEIVGIEENLLINATDISFDGVYDAVESFGGIMIPAHIDKQAYSLISNLGIIPEDSRFTCVEVKDMKHWHALRAEHKYLERCRVITNSDAHYIEHINPAVNTLMIEECTPHGVISTLKREILGSF